MKVKGILQRGLVCLGACLLFAGMAVYADETGSEPESRTTMEASGVTNTMVVDETSGKTETLAKPSDGVLCSLYDVEVENWKRRIYKIKCKVDSEGFLVLCISVMFQACLEFPELRQRSDLPTHGLG